MAGRSMGQLPAVSAMALVVAALLAGAARSSDLEDAVLLHEPGTDCLTCTTTPFPETDAPLADADWRLGLRGSYVEATGGSYGEAVLVPGVTLRRQTLRGGFGLEAEAEISRSTLEAPRVGAARLTLDGAYRLDRTTEIEGALDFTMSQDSARAPGTPASVASQPVVLSGGGEVEASREFGRLELGGRLQASRTSYGPTTLVDSSTVDNAHQSNWAAGGGLRLGYRVTPILTAFVDGSAGGQWYDAVSPTYLVRLDAADYAARAGLAGKWGERLEAEASIGYGLRRFVDPALGEAGSVLYDASLTYRPDETIEARAALATTFGAPGAGNPGTARLEHAATADIAYVVNPWLRLRGSAGWSRAEFIGTPDGQTVYRAGAGADYRINQFATATLDYGFTHRDATTSPPENEHRVTLGVTLSR